MITIAQRESKLSPAIDCREIGREVFHEVKKTMGKWQKKIQIQKRYLHGSDLLLHFFSSSKERKSSLNSKITIEILP